MKSSMHSYAVQMIVNHFPSLKPEDVRQRLRYSTFVSLPKRYMYFEVPKAGCSQMKELLRTLENAPPVKVFAGGFRISSRDLFVHARENVPLPSLADLDDHTQKDVLESKDFFRFTVVRNPYTRLVSAWRNKILLCEPEYEDIYFCVKGHLPELHAKKSLVSFEEFVDYIAKNCDLGTCNIHWRRQADHLFLPAFNFSCVAKLEQMAELLRRFQHHLGLSEPLVIDGKNVSAPVGAAPYTRALADKVYDLYQADFAVLGYDRNAWPRGGPTTTETPVAVGVPEEKFCHEIIERNLIISSLYRERDWLRAQVRTVTAPHLAGVDVAGTLRMVGLRGLYLLGLLKRLTTLRRVSLRGWMHKVLSAGAPPSV